MRISKMKKFVVRFSFFLVIMVLVDCLCGIVFPILQRHAKGGNTRINYYLSNKCDADVLVLGSSRAMHHYVPYILDSLGGVAFNAGYNGMGVILGYGRYLLCAERHVPKIVILDISSYDYAKDDNSKYLKFLRPYGDRKEIKSIISQIGEPFIQLKMHSHMYRNTSKIIHNISDFFVNEKNDNRGYSPLYGSCINCDEKSTQNENFTLELDTLKLKFFDQFVENVAFRGSKLYFAISPRYSNDIVSDSSCGLPSRYAYAEKLSEKYNVPLLNYAYVRGISDSPRLFTDRTHMNNDGAIAYTRRIVNELLAREFH